MFKRSLEKISKKKNNLLFPALLPRKNTTRNYTTVSQKCVTIRWEALLHSAKPNHLKISLTLGEH